ncbi:MAG: hypothetical protein Q8941_05510 [Bacteroidota bacterium]|nr:hypothetical protein [Bacteroidota bacterium]
MKKFIVVSLLLAAIIFACNEVKQSKNVAGGPGENPIANSFCPDTTHPNDFCPQLPYDVNLPFQAGYTAHLDPDLQPPFDIFSWQTFVALNWPADSAGNPMSGSIGDHPDALRVWEYYTDFAEIFGGSDQMILQLKDAKNSKLKFFHLTSKSNHHHRDSLSGFQEADTKPLIDRNLNFAVFDIKANPVETNFIITNNLETKSGINAFYLKNNKQFQLPASSAKDNSAGSMEIKTSWRILDTSKGDDPSRYYTRDAIIFISDSNSVTGKAFTIKAKVGLVGMHIIRKTGKFTKWIWSTFEHIDNTPDNIQEAQMDQHPTIPWSFYYPSTLGLMPGIPAAFLPGDNNNYKFDPSAPYAKRYAVSVFGEAGNNKVFGTQAQRVYPIYYRTQQVNRLWRDKLKGTVWTNYKLIGSQWTIGDPGIINTPNVPAMLGNTTLETFMLTNASCISCHGGATVAVGGNTIFTDFSYMIALNAQ